MGCDDEMYSWQWSEGLGLAGAGSGWRSVDAEADVVGVSEVEVHGQVVHCECVGSATGEYVVEAWVVADLPGRITVKLTLVEAGV
jgi:hypothetical protein